MDKFLLLFAKLTFDEWVSIIAQTLTLITVILVSLQLREAARQRRTTYQPLLAIPVHLVHVDPDPYSRSSRGLPFASKWRNIRSPHVDPDPKFSAPYLPLRIQNLGFGAAKDIQLKWSFPVDDSLNTIARYAEPLRLKISLLREEEPAVIQIKNHGLLIAREVVDTLDYVGPVSVSPEGEAVVLPFGYVISLLVYLLIENTNTNTTLGKHVPDDYFPPLTLTIRYRDIGNNSFTQTLIGKFRLSTVFSNPRRPDSYEGALEFA